MNLAREVARLYQLLDGHAYFAVSRAHDNAPLANLSTATMAAAAEEEPSEEVPTRGMVSTVGDLPSFPKGGLTTANLAARQVHDGEFRKRTLSNASQNSVDRSMRTLGYEAEAAVNWDRFYRRHADHHNSVARAHRSDPMPGQHPRQRPAVGHLRGDLVQHLLGHRRIMLQKE